MAKAGDLGRESVSERAVRLTGVDDLFKFHGPRGECTFAHGTACPWPIGVLATR